MNNFKSRDFWIQQLGEGWTEHIWSTLSSDNMVHLMNNLEQEYKSHSILPAKKEVFRAFRECPLDKLKVVILGQDPYPGRIGTFTRATGLAFANRSHLINTMSPSLKKIVERIEEDNKQLLLDFDPELTQWASQGVLLLNTALTVREGQINSHGALWRGFIYALLPQVPKDVIFMLWGKQAQELQDRIKGKCLLAEHPSYANRQGRLWNCDHFELTKNLIEWK
jgi:uracil-DNA glycosylase